MFEVRSTFYQFIWPWERSQDKIGLRLWQDLFINRNAFYLEPIVAAKCWRPTCLTSKNSKTFWLHTPPTIYIQTSDLQLHQGGVGDEESFGHALVMSSNVHGHVVALAWLLEVVAEKRYLCRKLWGRCLCEFVKKEKCWRLKPEGDPETMAKDKMDGGT